MSLDQSLQLILDAVRIEVVIDAALGQRARGILEHGRRISQGLGRHAGIGKRLDYRLLGLGSLARLLRFTALLLLRLLLELLLLPVLLREQVALLDSGVLWRCSALGPAACNEQDGTYSDQNVSHLRTPFLATAGGHARHEHIRSQATLDFGGPERFCATTQKPSNPAPRRASGAGSGADREGISLATTSPVIPAQLPSSAICVQISEANR